MDRLVNNNASITGEITSGFTFCYEVLGRRIYQMMVAVHRFGTTSDYIPCIAWGSNAKWASCRAVGTRVKIEGRVQSREYIKKLSDFESETRVAYEVSANRIWS